MTGWFPVYESLQGLKTLFELFIYTSSPTENPCPAASCARYIRCPFGLKIICLLCNSTYFHHSKENPLSPPYTPYLTTHLIAFAICLLEETRCLSECSCSYYPVGPISDRSRPQGPPLTCFASSPVALQPNFFDSTLRLRFLFGPNNCYSTDKATYYTSSESQCRPLSRLLSLRLRVRRKRPSLTRVLRQPILI